MDFCFNYFLETIKEGGVDVLLVYMIDRIGRFADLKDRNYVIELLHYSRTDVDSPYDELFRWDNEKELYDLEGPGDGLLDGDGPLNCRLGPLGLGEFSLE